MLIILRFNSGFRYLMRSIILQNVSAEGMFLDSFRTPEVMLDLFRRLCFLVFASFFSPPSKGPNFSPNKRLLILSETIGHRWVHQARLSSAV